jgi:hypothetical protein
MMAKTRAAAPKPRLIAIKKAEELWSIYELENGVTLRVRPLVVEIEDSGRKSPQGDPVYGVKGGMIVDVKAPARRRKKPSNVA